MKTTKELGTEATPDTSKDVVSIIPAAPGFYTVGPVTKGGLVESMWKAPVIAWAIRAALHKGLEDIDTVWTITLPVTIDGTQDFGVVLRPDGKVEATCYGDHNGLASGGDTFETLDDYTAELRAHYAEKAAKAAA